MKASRRNEIIFGLAVPLIVIAALLALALTTEQADACIAFMAVAPMLAAMFTGVVLTGVVAVAAFAAAMGAAVVTYGEYFSESMPIVIGVIVAASVSVVVSQLKFGGVPRGIRSGRQAGAASAEQVEQAAGPAAEPASDVDDLTGLPSRGAATRELTGSTGRGTRVVALVDCDRMAWINDEYGSHIGDEFIFAVGGRTRFALPPHDTVARWDGDEFLIVITGDMEAVLPTIELVAEKVNRNPIRTGAGLVPATISVGAAVWHEGAEFESAVVRAGRALHLAKSRGVAQVVVDETTHEADAY